MPEITIKVVSMDSAPVSAQSCRFAGLGGTIGRDNGNTLVLQDPHRRVSRLHASVTFPKGLAVITNTSTSLPVTVGTTVLANGQKLRICADDMIEIGPFVLRVVSQQLNDVEDGPLTHNEPAALAFPASLSNPPLPRFSAVDEKDPIADLFLDISSLPKELASKDLPAAADSFANRVDLGAPPVGSEMPAAADRGVASIIDLELQCAAPLGAHQQSECVPAHLPAAIISDHFNPFELPSEIGQNSANPLAEIMAEGSSQGASSASSSEPTIDSLIAPLGSAFFVASTVADSPSPSFQDAGLNSMASPAASSDPMKVLDPSAADFAIPAGASMADDMADIGAADQPQAAFIPNAFPSSGPSRDSNLDMNQLASGDDASVDALTAAFLQGAGLAVSALPGGITPEVMAVIGRLLRCATAGAIDMLAARAATKLELQANVTMISARSDNPLKLLPDAESAMQQMLSQSMPGFMQADEAMQSAFADLRAHEIGVTAGIRAALTEVLDRFDPSVLEQRLTNESLLESLLPAIRKKKLWESFLGQYWAIRREAEDDFHAVFGHSFLAAYEQESAHVKTHQAESGK